MVVFILHIISIYYILIVSAEATRQRSQSLVVDFEACLGTVSKFMAAVCFELIGIWLKLVCLDSYCFFLVETLIISQ